MSEIESSSYRAYRYRWIILILYIFIAMVTQIYWLTFSPINNLVANTMGVPNEWIVQMTATFMYAYIPVNFVASYLIDKLGLKWGVGVGVILTGVFGFLRALNSTNFWWVCAMQIGIAIGQPFILNASVKLAGEWFKEDEKAMATGLGTMAQFLGSIIGFIVSPIIIENFIAETSPGIFEITKQGMDLLLYIYGGIGLGIATLYLIFVKNKPPTPPNRYAEKTKVMMWSGVKKLFKTKDFVILTVCIFIALGAFNAMSSLIDGIFEDQLPIGDTSTAGLIAGVLIIGGIIGAIILPAISDKVKKRKIFLIIAFLSAVPLLILLDYFTNIPLLFALSGVTGFLLISSLPIGLTYGAEITHPVPEETSTGVLMLSGQISGILFILIPPQYVMYAMSGLFLIAAILTFFTKDIDHYKLEATVES